METQLLSLGTVCLSLYPLLSLSPSLPLQPLQLSGELDTLLLNMCEDVVLRRADLLRVLETCKLHHKASLLPPPDRTIKQLVEDVFRDSVSAVRWGSVGFGLV